MSAPVRWDALDRRAGRVVRDAAQWGGAPVAQGLSVAAAVMSPAFRAGVAVMIAVPRTRRAGLTALGASVSAAMAARVARDRIARPRPGARPEGGMPSRHAAAAVAITTVVGATHPALGGVARTATSLGLLGRVAAAQHDPADIAAGAVLGWAVARVAVGVATLPTVRAAGVRCGA